MKRIYTLGLIIFLSFNLFSQRGKDGVTTISTANTIVNQYTSLTQNASTGNTTLTVASSASFSVGDLIFIIQMQGALINAGRDTIFPDVNSSVPTNTTHGAITNYNNSGNNEFAQIKSIPNATSIELDCGLSNNYLFLGKVQVVKVPRYNSLLISGGGSITCPTWNGTTGGVAIVEVENNATLNSTPSFSVTGKGFRGGAIITQTLNFLGGDKYGSLLVQEGAYKGESIAGDTTRYKVYSGLFGRGAMANGGGGGCAHNAGGGGGANGGNIASYNGRGNPVAGYSTIWNRESTNFALNTSSGGGRGGYTFSNANQSLTTVSPAATSWGGDYRRVVGGYGGRPLDYSTGKLFIGGGGGAGHGNDALAGAGGNGGGMVYILCYGNLSGSGTIVADGANGGNAVGSSFPLPCSKNDGAGGAGGGGTIILNVAGTTNLTATTPLFARGGTGGNVNFNCGISDATGYGPGAGGGGGYIATSGAIVLNNISGGANGIQTGNNSNISTSFPPNGATAGGAGSVGSVANYTITTSPSVTLCVNQPYTLTATSNLPGSSINWYNTLVGGSAIATGTAYASPGYTAAGTYTLFAGACSGTYRQPITITVNTGLNITVNSPTICPSQTVVLTANGATTYTWVSGPSTSTISVSPTTTTVYTVNGTSGLCSGTKTTTVTVSAQPTITVANTTICAGSSATLTANGATNYTWSPGGQTTASIVVTPTSNTTYSITGANGTCSNSTTASVSVTSTPTLSASSKTICEGQIATFTVSGATSYTWNPGGISGNTYTTNATSSGTISVIGTNSTCTSQITTSLTVNPNPTVTVSNQTICPTQSVTLTANGATTYSWNTGATTNTINVTPSSTTVYTVNGTTNSCVSQKTVTVTVATQPTITVANATICSGNSATLTANGATNYTWNPGAQTTTSIVVTPTTNTTYSITGFNGTCSNTTTATVSITTTPTLALNSVTICTGQTATLTVSGATTYTWNPGSVTGTTYTITPASSTTVSVIGANGTCTSQATASVTIGSGISIAVNSETICSGQTASLTASGATSYTWNTGANTNTLNVSPTSTTIYTITGTNGSCNGINTATVTVNSAPTLTVNNANICSGQTATLTVSGANTYTWSNSVIGNTQTLSPNSTTVYTVTGTAINGCESLITSTVSVGSTPTISVNSSSICSGQSATLTASGATSYTWSTLENTSSINPSPTTNTTYTVTGDNGGCSASATTTVSVDNTTLSTYSLAVNTCPADTVTLFGAGTNSTTTTYTWSNGVNTYSQTVNPVTTTTYVVNSTSFSGCPASSGTVIVNVNSISAEFSGLSSDIITLGETLNLTDVSTGATSILWDYCNGTSSNSQITIPLNDTGSCCIKLVAINAACKDSVTKCVTIIKESVVSIPNVFTPNGDGSNDVFKIKSSGLKTLTCAIYDRWGLKMYEWDGINGFWDGATKSGIAPDGTYYYIVTYTDLKDKSTTEKGFLNIFKD